MNFWVKGLKAEPNFQAWKEHLVWPRRGSGCPQGRVLGWSGPRATDQATFCAPKNLSWSAGQDRGWTLEEGAGKTERASTSKLSAYIRAETEIQSGLLGGKGSGKYKKLFGPFGLPLCPMFLCILVLCHLLAQVQLLRGGWGNGDTFQP